MPARAGFRAGADCPSRRNTRNTQSRSLLRTAKQSNQVFFYRAVNVCQGGVHQPILPLEEHLPIFRVSRPVKPAQGPVQHTNHSKTKSMARDDIHPPKGQCACALGRCCRDSRTSSVPISVVGRNDGFGARFSGMNLWFGDRRALSTARKPHRASSGRAGPSVSSRKLFCPLVSPGPRLPRWGRAKCEAKMVHLPIFRLSRPVEPVEGPVERTQTTANILY